MTTMGHQLAADVTVQAGRSYRDAFLGGHPGGALITINDASKPHGGRRRITRGISAGSVATSACRAPMARHRGIRHHHALYDREAMRATLIAFRGQPLVTRISSTIRSRGRRSVRAAVRSR